MRPSRNVVSATAILGSYGLCYLAVAAAVKIPDCSFAALSPPLIDRRLGLDVRASADPLSLLSCCRDHEWCLRRVPWVRIGKQCLRGRKYWSTFPDGHDRRNLEGHRAEWLEAKARAVVQPR